MSGALAGVRVVEFSHELTAWAGKLFADLGAEVIVVEPPGGSHLRTWAPFLDDVPGPERMAESAQIEQRVQGALQELSPLERAAFTLRHYEGRSIDEISATLGLGTSAAKHSVFRAVKKLRIALAPLRSQES